jgi:hypothetical protein
MNPPHLSQISALSVVSLNLAVMALYGVAFLIQINLLVPYDYLPGVSLLFLPHGVRVLAILIGRAYAIPGLFAGSAVVSISVFGDASIQAWVAALLSAVMPYVALRTIEACRGGRILTESLNLTSVGLFIVASAALNALAHTILFMSFDAARFTSVTDTVLSMAQGDVGGGLLLIALLWLMLKTTTWLIIPTALESVATRTRFQVSVIEQIGLVAGALMLTSYLSAAIQGVSPAPHLSVFFLPAVVKVLAILRFRILGAIGLFLGGLAVSAVPEGLPMYPVWLASICAITGYLSLLVWEQVSAPWRLTPLWDVLGFSVVFAVASSALHLLFYCNYSIIPVAEIERAYLVLVTGMLTPVLLGVLPILWMITRLRAAA